jgi:Rhodopirellula transposase DDE domain
LIQIDTKAKVKIGNLSRGGYSRLKKAPQTDDHDHKSVATLVPFGIYELDTYNVFLIFGQSHETADFILDALEQWWTQRQFMQDNYDVLMIDLDNGKAVASNTKQFMKRITEFAKKINMPIKLVYYPPYHSKYNAIEFGRL